MAQIRAQTHALMIPPKVRITTQMQIQSFLSVAKHHNIDADDALTGVNHANMTMHARIGTRA